MRLVDSQVGSSLEVQDSLEVEDTWASARFSNPAPAPGG